MTGLPYDQTLFAAGLVLGYIGAGTSKLRPRVLVDVNTRSTETTLFGKPMSMPLAVAPIRLVRAGASGPRLITALGQTGRLQLAFGALLTVGLAIRL